MVVNDCDCKDVTVTEGIFGEIYAESPEDYLYRYDGEKYDRAKLSSSVNDGEATGEPRSIPVKSYTMINKNRVEIVVISWGATIVSVKFPDKFGRVADVVLGFDDMKSYTDPRINSFIGCVLGRCANRIRNGRIAIKGKTYQLTINDLNEHHLHGGTNGFGRRSWQSHIDGCSVIMSYLSEDGEEGYPGAVLCTDAGKKELMKHKVSLNCDRWTFADYTDPIPTGSIRGVGGTIMDLRVAKLLENCIEKVPPGEGYDHNFCVTPNWHAGSGYVARAVHPRSGRVLEVYSNQPGVQFYTGGRLSPCVISEADDNVAMTYDDNPNYEEDDEEQVSSADETEQNVVPECKSSEYILGKQGARYAKHCAFSIQPQNYPNAINYSHFPCSILRPGQVYCHDLTYKFGIQLANYM